MSNIYNFDSDGLNSFMSDLEAQIINASMKQLVDAGQKYYCPNCSKGDNVVSSDVQTTCSGCSKELEVINYW